jgi:S1-C subfamily serine protease
VRLAHTFGTFLAASILSGCVGPLVPVIRLDDSTVSDIKKDVRIYRSSELTSQQYRYLEPVSATSCMNKLWDSPASAEDATAQVLYKAKLTGANAVDSLICERVEGTSLAKNCWNSVTCYARAIHVSDKIERAERSDEHKSGGAGTGFVVSHAGEILTAAHVVNGCNIINGQITGQQVTLTPIKVDKVNDLALLASKRPATAVATFRTGKGLRAGDDVVAVGYPLSGLLASEANVTVGTVSALAGIGNDTRFIQMTAPVQQGNSGGPLIDRSGNVVGVVVSKLDSIKIAMASGDIPQNVNFAISSKIVELFLDGADTRIKGATSEKDLRSADIGDLARQFTIPVSCE